MAYGREGELTFLNRRVLKTIQWCDWLEERHENEERRGEYRLKIRMWIWWEPDWVRHFTWNWEIDCNDRIGHSDSYYWDMWSIWCTCQLWLNEHFCCCCLKKAHFLQKDVWKYFRGDECTKKYFQPSIDFFQILWKFYASILKEWEENEEKRENEEKHREMKIIRWMRWITTQNKRKMILDWDIW